MRTPLSRVLGPGTAGGGTGHFWAQRLTSLALLPLALFVVALVVSLIGAGREEAAATLARPVVALPLLLTLAAAAWHMKLGMQDIIDDYVHSPRLKRLAETGNILFAIAVAAASAFALLKLGLGS